MELQTIFIKRACLEKRRKVTVFESGRRFSLACWPVLFVCFLSRLHTTTEKNMAQEAEIENLRKLMLEKQEEIKQQRQELEQKTLQHEVGHR